MIDLDSAEYADPDSLRGYATACLTQLVDTSPYRHLPAQYVHTVAEAIAAAAGLSFLVALITSRSLALREQAVADPHDQHWRAGLPTLAADAMRDDLDARLGEQAVTARHLLLPLAYAQGGGLPWESLWPALATALSGTGYTSADLQTLIAQAGYYITESTVDGQRSVYRLFHEALAEHLRADRDRAADHAVITAVLTQRVPRLGDGQLDWAHAHPYTRTHLATHAALAGHLDPLLLQPRFLLAAAPAPLRNALPAASSDDARSAAYAYQLADAVHHNSDRPERRVAHLQLAAAYAGEPTSPTGSNTAASTSTGAPSGPAGNHTPHIGHSAATPAGSGRWPAPGSMAAT